MLLIKENGVTFRWHYRLQLRGFYSFDRQHTSFYINSQDKVDEALATNIGVTSIKYVKYIDESPDDIFSDLAELDLGEFEKFRRDLFFYKLSDFSDEREVRIFREKTPPLLSRLVTADPTDQHRLEQFFKNTHAIQKEDVFPGRSRLNDLITEIVISPTAHSGIFTIVKDLLKSLNEMRASKGYSVFDINKVRESRRKMWY